MNNKVVGIIFFSLSLVFSSVQAAGRITSLNFKGPDSPDTPSIIQIKIEGGYNVAGCSPTFAAIRSTGDRAFLINFAMFAYKTQEPISIEINQNDKYYLDRCTISGIANVN